VLEKKQVSSGVPGSSVIEETPKLGFPQL